MCVRFADDCGQLLETVRMMTEPSDHPPRVSSAVILRHRMAAAAADGAMIEGGGHEGVDCHGPKCTWRAGFKQPASEYVKFRETLKQQKVALENVVLREETCRMVGTVKVVNIGLVKRVFVRYTTDGWRSYLDQPATLQPSPRSKTFDTFYFEIDLPNSSVEVQRVGSQHSANNLHNHLECSNGLLRLLYCQRDRRVLGLERGPKLPTALQLRAQPDSPI
jgi:protein phosphatase 1 regulatory subunit 3A/B/C/D/E